VPVMMSSAVVPVKNILGIVKTIPGAGENRSPSRRNRCSPSARNSVRLHPGTLFTFTPESAFTFARNPRYEATCCSQAIAAEILAYCSLYATLPRTPFQARLRVADHTSADPDRRYGVINATAFSMGIRVLESVIIFACYPRCPKARHLGHPPECCIQWRYWLCAGEEFRG